MLPSPPFRASGLWFLASSSFSTLSGFWLQDTMMSLQCFTNLSMCFIHSVLFFACVGQVSRLSGSACLRKLTMSASQRFLGRAWTRPRGRLECRSGCQIVAMALHFSASFVTRLQAQRDCLLLHVTSHSLCPACLSCSSVHLAVRLRNSDHGSSTSTSSVFPQPHLTNVHLKSPPASPFSHSRASSASAAALFGVAFVDQFLGSSTRNHTGQ